MSYQPRLDRAGIRAEGRFQRVGEAVAVERAVAEERAAEIDHSLTDADHHVVADVGKHHNGHK